jgi:DNA polymerase III subunit delta
MPEAEGGCVTLFFYGDNGYAIREQVRQMVSAYLKKTGSDLGLERIDGSAIAAQELAARLEAAPFLATSRLVIVNQVATNKQVSPHLSKIIGKVPATTVAVFVEGTVDQRTSAFKALGEVDKVVKFDPISGGKLRSWVATEVTKLGGSIDTKGVSRLIELGGEDQWRLSNEIAKLVNYDKNVTAETIDKLVVPSPESSIFDLVDAMTAGKGSAAINVYRLLLSQKQTAMYVLSMVQWQLRMLVVAKAARGKRTSEVAKAFGMKEYALQKAIEKSARMPEERIHRAFAAAADCEFDIKTGRVKPELAVELLIHHVAEAAA